MTTLTRRMTTISSAILSVVALGGCVMTPLVRDDRSMTHEYVAGEALRVTTGNGRIEVTPSKDDVVTIEAVLKSPDEVRLADAVLVAEHDENGALHVFVDWPGTGRKGREQASFTITLPDAAGLELRTSNGSIETSGMSGVAKLRTSNGAIRVTDHTGAIDADTSNGAIVITGATESVIADTSNGGVRVTFVPDAAGPVQISTSNGAVDVDLGAAFEGELAARTSNGSVNVKNLGEARFISSGKRSLTLQVGDSESKSRIISSNGSIRVSGTTSD